MSPCVQSVCDNRKRHKAALSAYRRYRFFFHDAMPPSVMVGDMAGMANFESAERGAEVRSADRD